MILIYIQKLTPRINYIFHHLLVKILGLELKFTTKIEEFIAFSGPKFSYGKSRMGNEFFIEAFGLLEKQGVAEIEPEVGKWGEIPCFFKLSAQSDLPFDIFSASFYLLSRYEEYVLKHAFPHHHFRAEDSLAYKSKFLLKPVVDLWAYKLGHVLKEHFPQMELGTRKFTVNNVLAVEEAYKYKNKGIMRGIGGMANDVFRFRFREVFERIGTEVFASEDPYNIYDRLRKFSQQHKIKWIFMFQLSDYSVNDKNLSYTKSSYRALIKSMADYGKVGLLVGHDAMQKKKTFKVERKRWEEILNRELELTLSNDHDLNIPNFYNILDALEISHDYSMGFPFKLGFRAGTCTSFFFYDLMLERTSPLLLHPTAFNSVSFDPISFFEVKKALKEIKRNVQEVDGKLITLFKNYNFVRGENQERYLQLLELMNED